MASTDISLELALTGLILRHISRPTFLLWVWRAGDAAPAPAPAPALAIATVIISTPLLTSTALFSLTNAFWLALFNTDSLSLILSSNKNSPPRCEGSALKVTQILLTSAGRVHLPGTNKNLSSFLLNEVSHAKTRQNINHGYPFYIFPLSYKAFKMIILLDNFNNFNNPNNNYSWQLFNKV